LSTLSSLAVVGVVQAALVVLETVVAVAGLVEY
jgi:hypothetical protein